MPLLSLMPEKPLFSAKELRYLNDQEFLINKQVISEKMSGLLGEVEQRLCRDMDDRMIPAGVLMKSGKISRGEQYQHLPYMILDYPRLFSGANVFAFRTLFWWGNFFSSSLHLSGSFLESFRAPLKQNLTPLEASNTYICVNKNPWQYHYETSNYQLISDCEQSFVHNLIDSSPFVKISRKWPLAEYKKLPGLVNDCFSDFISLLHIKQ